MGTRVDPPWATASELGEYEFCPRASWYARTRGEPSVPDPRAEAGSAYHHRALRAVRRRAEHRLRYGLILAFGLVLAASATFLVLHGT